MMGIDLGNWSCYFQDDEGFPEDKRMMGNGHVKTLLSQIKCLLGRKFSDPELQSELDYVPFRVIEGPRGYPLVHGRCNGEDRAFTPVEILAMLISSPQFLARKKYSDASPCIGIPMYFTDQQKNNVLEAAKIAGLPASFCLLDETTARAVAHEGNLLFKPQCIVAFVDIGHTSMQVCFAEFKGDCLWSPFDRKRSVNILYKGYARSLGGREFDKVLFKHFASKIRKEYNIDVSKNSSACVRLSEACEHLKHDLRYCDEASFCLMEFSDSIAVKGSITRNDFEGLSFSILKKIEVILKKALSESGLNVKKIDFIETDGKTCSNPAIIDILTKVFGDKPRKRIFYEHVARGCAMHARQQNITGMDKRINDLTAGLETSELVSSELNSEEEKAKDSEIFFWRRAMGEEGHLLSFLNGFLEKNMHHIGRSKKTKDESYWLSKANYFAEYSYSELQDATNNFNESFKLGEGGFGIVYKGILHNTTLVSIFIHVAIKMLKEGSSQGAKEFNQEVEILSKVRHPNLVKLIGACAETHALIYEYLPNGSLEDRLRCRNNTFPLSWQARVRIAFEICSALSFLHCRKPHGIVHGDLKPDNVLLDGNGTSKICDFGLCRKLNWTASESIPYHWTDCPKGTLAYMDPEYFSTGKITPQYDVFFFWHFVVATCYMQKPTGYKALGGGGKEDGYAEDIN